MADRLVGMIRRFRWQLLVIWLVALAAAGIAALPLAGRLSGGGWYVPGSESREAVTALQSGFASRGASNLVLVVRDERNTVDSPQFASRVDRVSREVTADRRLETVGTYGWLGLSEASRGRFVGADRRTALTLVGMGIDDGTARRVLPAVQDEIADRYAGDGMRVALVSAGSLFGEINKLSQEGLARAELIAFPLILLILLWLYRGVVATVVSFVVSLTALGLTFGVLSLIAGQVELSIFVQNAATMIGLGVSVDYSLFIISRYAEELRRGLDRRAALVTTLRTSGETVLFSGLIVVLAMCSLFLVDLNVIRSIALGIIVVVAFAVVASVVILPLLLYMLGDRILKGAVRLPSWRRSTAAGQAGRTVESGRWYRVAQRIMRRPVVYLIVPVIALLALAVPTLGLRTFTPDARVVPQSSPVRFGFDAIREQFGQGVSSPLQVAVQSRTPLGSTDSAPVLALAGRLAGLAHVSRVDSALEPLRTVNPQQPLAALSTVAQLPPDAQQTVNHFVSTDHRTMVFEVVPDDYASSQHALDLLPQVRAEAHKLPGQLRAVVGGETAEGVDANAAINDRLPVVVLVMLAVIYLLLLLTFRSVLLPVKAIAMNLLSAGATYGLLILVFQHGFGVDLIGADSFGYVQNFVPILLLAILFSLSTDYEVFLLNRVREEYRTTLDNTTSVATGVARTAPMISGAAVLMLAVFGAFTITGINPIQQLGFGLAIAIALDATIIRLVVVPASMKLMGRWNWWMPGRGVRRPALAIDRKDAVR